jgi:transketolase N-terminal domain/subunit
MDRNNFQQPGCSSTFMSVGELSAKWGSFGWNVVVVEGYSIGELQDAFR